MTSFKAPQDLLRQARRALLSHGDLSTVPLQDRLLRSWQRSLSAGLSPLGRLIETDRVAEPDLRRQQTQQRDFIAHAAPVMEYLYDQVRSTESMVILSDRQGLLVHVEGDPLFLDKAERVALTPGAIWREEVRGTNAIGTALAEGAAVEVHGQEHFLERNGFLTCAAAPIRDPLGVLLGVIDISGDQRSRHPHTHGLVRTAARMVESSLFAAANKGAARLHLHPKAEGIGTLAEGAIALAEDGWIIGATPAGLDMLGLTPTDLGARRIDDVLDVSSGELFDRARRQPREIHRLPRRNGGQLFLRLEIDPAPLHPTTPRRDDSAPAATTPTDALAALDSGDLQISAVVSKLRRVLGKPISILLAGESGVGKERFARAIHASGPRRDKPYIALNCAALPENLIEAELFGYAPGAFTGARKEGSPGRLREADGGTLFLDEIGDMPLALQARLLRALQEREVTPLGGGATVKVDFALICASNRNLRQDVEGGRFRSDLYYRINGLPLTLPALRERSDLAATVQRVLHAAAPDRPLRLTPDVLAAFLAYRWPGNLRQLASALQTATALLDDDEHVIAWHHLPDDLRDEIEADARLSERRTTLRDAADEDTLKSQAFSVIEKTLTACRGNISAAARRLGISRNTLYRRLEEARRQGDAQP